MGEGAGGAALYLHIGKGSPHVDVDVLHGTHVRFILTCRVGECIARQCNNLRWPGGGLRMQPPAEFIRL